MGQLFGTERQKKEKNVLDTPSRLGQPGWKGIQQRKRIMRGTGARRYKDALCFK